MLDLCKEMALTVANFGHIYAALKWWPDLYYDIDDGTYWKELPESRTSDVLQKHMMFHAVL